GPVGVAAAPPDGGGKGGAAVSRADRRPANSKPPVHRPPLPPRGRQPGSARPFASAKKKMHLLGGCPEPAGRTKGRDMQRRKTIALTPEEQRRFLEESHTIILTSNDRRGYPHSVAMWYVADRDGTVVMTTFDKSQKAVNLRRDPRCALLVDGGRT